ncbi:hypothetical protein L2E82_09448 [Cichorium intybus]|uniref:Uncharacterized protein n=1 Tax=Cichorium intybus TaxID=13427 RepID=A0ACB9GAG8_CICIN|nr:hypothetical protein L2E82_09448 [Cichorium intybus]
MGLSMGRCLVHLVVHGSVYGTVPCSPGRLWVCLWHGALFTWSSMGLSMGRCLVHLVVHGSVYGTVPCSPGRPWVCVWHCALFPRVVPVYGTVPCSPGRPWVCVWHGALFTLLSMGLSMGRCLVHLVVHGSVYGTVPCSPGRPWVCLWHCLVHLVVHGSVYGTVPCSPGRPWVCLWDGALFTWSSMGLCMALCLVSLCRSWVCVWHDALFPRVVHGSVYDTLPCSPGRPWCVYGTVPCSPGRPWVCVWHDALFPRQTRPVVHGVRHDMPCSHCPSFTVVCKGFYPPLDGNCTSWRPARLIRRTGLANDTCLWGPRPLLLVGKQAAGTCVASSPDSDLEAFSHNPAHGSFAPLAFQPSAMTNCANQRFLSY